MVDDFNFFKNLADRANSGFYTRRELAFAGDPGCMIGGVDYFLKSTVEYLRSGFQKGKAGSFPWEFPVLLVPPIPGRAPIVSSEENPGTGREIQKLLADLGTLMGAVQKPSKPQKFQIGDRVKNKSQEAGTILNVNDGDFLCVSQKGS